MIEFKKYDSSPGYGYERYHYNYCERALYSIYLDKTTDLVDLTKFSNGGGFVYTQDRGWQGIGRYDPQFFLIWDEAIDVVTLDIL